MLVEGTVVFKDGFVPPVLLRLSWLTLAKPTGWAGCEFTVKTAFQEGIKGRKNGVRLQIFPYKHAAKARQEGIPNLWIIQWFCSGRLWCSGHSQWSISLLSLHSQSSGKLFAWWEADDSPSQELDHSADHSFSSSISSSHLPAPTRFQRIPS